ncbi:MAG: trimeric intracellular cation channel family protein [Saccharospirillum sp.]
MWLYYLDLAGVAVFAASGVLAARDRALDLFGVIIVATLTAIGGGTLRDLLLDRHPIFWITDNTYLVVIIVAAIATTLYLRARPAPGKAFLTADALGLALFAISGAKIALAADLSPLIAIMTGTMTGVMGGVLRDVITVHTPLILKREIYATAAMAGIVVYWGLGLLSVPEPAAFLAGFVTVVALRLAAIHRGWHLPTFTPRS